MIPLFHRLNCLGCTVIVLAALSLVATESSAEMQCVITNWTNGNHVTDMVQGAAYNWAASTGGLVRWNQDFDGYVKYTTKDGLADNWFNCCASDQDGRVYFGSLSGGITIFDHGSWSRIGSESGVIPYNEILAMDVDPQNRVWFSFGGALGNGLACKDGGNWTYFRKPDGLAHNYIRAIQSDESGVWVGHVKGINRIENGEVVAGYDVSHGLVDDVVYALAIDQDGCLWIGTQGGISRFDGEHFTNFTDADGLPSNMVNTLYVDSKTNLLWAGTERGAAYLETTDWQSIDDSAGLHGSDVRFFLRTSDDRLISGTHDFGLNVIQNRLVTATVLTDDDLPGNYIRRIIQDSTTLWVGCGNGRVGCYDGDTWLSYEFQPEGQSTWVNGLAVDQQGTLWIGTFGNGLYRFDGEEWERFTAPDTITSDLISGIYVDRAGQLWIPTFGGGVSVYNGTEWSCVDAADGLPVNLTYHVTQDLQDHYWICTDLGVSCWNGHEMVNYYEEDGLIFHRVYEADVDSDNIKWFGACKGLSRFNGSEFTNYYESDGLVHYRVRDIIFEPDDMKWIATGGGVSRFNGSAFENLTVTNGLAGYETFKILPAGHTKYWACTKSGLSKIAVIPPDCTELKCVIEMPSHIINAGELFWCDVLFCNPEDSWFETPLFVLLNVGSQYFFAPGFGAYDFYTAQIEPGVSSVTVLEPFVWPETGTSGEAMFIAAFTDAEITQILGLADAVQFSWTE